MKSGDEFSCRIDKVVYGGKGLSRIEGVVVFTPGTAPGETVRVRIEKVRKNFAEGRLLAIENPSAARIQNDCTIGTVPMPGCAYGHLTPEAELEIKQGQYEDFLTRIFKNGTNFSPPENSPRILHYRNKITLHFQDGELGYLREGTHRTIDTPACPLATEEVNELLGLFRGSEAFKTLNNGDRITVRAASETGRCVIRISGRGKKSFWDEKNDVFFRHPEPELFEKSVCGVLGVGASGFYQVNIPVSRAVTETVSEWYARDAERLPELLDLYCGVGVFAFACSSKAPCRIVGIESSGEAVESAVKNASRLGVRAKFIRASLAGGGAIHAKWVREPSRTAVVVDPPRAGMESGCVQSLVKFGFKKIFYVSCDPATLARDAAALAAGGYVPARAKLFNMFPRTARFETVTEFVLN